MQPINTPLTLGQTGPEVGALQQALMYLITNDSINVSDTHLVNAIGEEYIQKLFGSATTTIVRLFQVQHGLPETDQPVFNEDTRAALNTMLTLTQVPGQKIMSGRIKTTSGIVTSAIYTVKIYKATFDGIAITPLATTISDASGNYYVTLDNTSAGDGQKTGYQAQATHESVTHSSDITYLYGDKLILDITIPDDAPALSEYEEIYNALIPLTDAGFFITFSAGDDAKFEFLAASTGEREDYIRLVVEAQRIKSALGNVNAPLVYGLLRNNVPATLQTLPGQPADVLKRATIIAESGNVIPAMTGAEIEQAINELRAAAITYAVQINSGQNSEDTAIYRILIDVIEDPAMTAKFIDSYFNAGVAGDAAFWTNIADDNDNPFYNLVNDLKAALSLALLTRNNPAVVKRLLYALKNNPIHPADSIPGVSNYIKPELLVNLSIDDWEGIVSRAEATENSGFFYPSYVHVTESGETVTYTQYLYEQTKLAFPTHAIAKEVSEEESSPLPMLQNHLPDFLELNDGFDFRTTPVIYSVEGNEFNYGSISEEPDAHGVTDRDRFVSQLGIVQRLMYLSTSYPDISAMASKGYISSLSIAQQPQAQFAQNMASAMSAGTASAVYSTAQNVANYAAAAMIGSYGAATTGKNNPNSGSGSTAPAVNGLYFDPNQLYGEWRTLFGTLDGCDCCQCQSVYSASAYMVDTLRFLKDNTSANGPLHDEFIDNRRPDIKHVQLTCKNANTPVPQIDIVNELLEDLISPTTGGAYKMYARQTSTDAATQRAIPEYVNTDGEDVMDWIVPSSGSAHYAPLKLYSPYPVLASAIYPWSQPYDFYKRQVDIHLDLAGVKGHELIQRFSGDNKLAAFNDYRYCYEYLGISQNEADLITTSRSGNAPYFGVLPYYGMKHGGATTPISVRDPAKKGQTLELGPNIWSGDTKVTSGTTTLIGLGYRVDVFLQQTGLTYSELLQIRDCYSLNPIVPVLTTIGVPPPPVTRKWDIGPNDPGVAVDTCNLAELMISGLEIDVLSLLFRFVRLARALGWTFYELDSTLLSLGITNKYGIGTPASGTTGTGSGPIPNPALVDQNAFATTGSGSNDAFNSIVQLKYLTALLNVSVEDATLLFSHFNTLPYRDYTTSEPKDIPSIYARVFRNPAISDINAVNYPFGAEAIFSATAPPKEEVISYLSGILNVAGNDLELLLNNLSLIGAGGTIAVSLYMLSLAYREALLLKALGLTVSEWLFYKKWLGDTAHFGNAGDTPYNLYIDFSQLTPDKVIRLFTLVKEFRECGLSIADTDYLLADNMPDSIADDKLNAGLVNNLTALRAQLNEKWAPAYDASADTEGTKLFELLKKIIDVDKATRLISLVQRTATDFMAMTASNLFASINNLVSSDLDFFLTVANTATMLATGTNSLQDRREDIFNQLDDYMRTTVLQPLVLSFFAKEYNANAGFIGKLLQDCIQITGPSSGITVTESALYFLTDKDFVESTAAINRWAAANPLEGQVKAALLLQKALFLAPLFKLGDTDAEYFWQKSNVFTDVLRLNDLPLRTAQATQVTTVTPFSKLANFLRWMRIRTFLGESAQLLYPALEILNTATSPSKAAFLDTLALAYKMDRTDMDTLLGTTTNGSLSVGFAANTAYSLPLVYLRVIDALEMQHLLPATMATLADIAGGIQNGTHPQQDVNKVIQLVKAQYDGQQWLGVIRPVNDKLRVERRDAMVTWLLANPPAGCEARWFTANDIFETLMVDVEMMACMSTSRLLLAINSVQLWVDRVMLGLEQYTLPAAPNTYLTMKMEKDNVRQWHSWRKRYRIWEANRKIFIYPENWIEPELRDGKTPLFLELEKFLKQNEVTDENVEAAYRTYLERLDELAHLDIIGIYRETSQTNYTKFTYDKSDVTSHDIIHAFGRTPVHPHTYYYRKRVADEWTPWEKMDVQVDGDHFVPVMWRGRLRFYWLVFAKHQAEDNGSKVRSNEQFTTPASTQWKINLAFTEYKNGKWTAKQVSKEALYSNEIQEERLTSIDQWAYFLDQEWKQNEIRCWFLPGTSERVKKERIYFYNTIDSNGNLRFEIVEKFVRLTNGQINDHVASYNGVSNRAVSRWANNNLSTPSINNNSEIPDVLEYYNKNEILNQVYPLKLGVFTVQFNGIIAQDRTDYPDPNLFWPYEYFPSGWQLNSGGLEKSGYLNSSTDLLYDHAYGLGYLHEPDNDIPLLGKAPDQSSGKPINKFIVFPRQIPQGYIKNTKQEIPYFFYKDYDNTFFVEKTIREVKMGSGTSVYSPHVFYTNSAGSSGPRAWIPFYRFHNFRHEKVNTFRELLFSGGVEALLDRQAITSLSDTIDFKTIYDPNGLFVDITSTATTPSDNHFPENTVDFRHEAAFSSYNWELFFHIPLLIANKLSQNRQFEEARKWYQYVFNPTVTNSTLVSDFWNFQPFYDEATKVPSILSTLTNPNLPQAVNIWANNPFKPHLVARTRTSAYMKNTVMKYLDNLIAWGDDLFRSDSRESIVEATLLYVLAAQILGRRPVTIPARATPAVQTYMTLLANPGGFTAFGNALVKVESIMYASGVNPGTVAPPTGTTGLISYFCIPPNTKLSSYWDTLADRLFKIRNCRNIDGVERDLALYDPPIDPALLVKAAAAGISATDAMAAANAPLPNYRFNVMAQKATELAGEVKALGGQLLAALEKKDAEHLALLRSSQEQKVLDAVTELKEQGVEEAVTQINGLQQQQTMTTQRHDHYKRLVDSGLNSEEQLQLESMQDSIPLHIEQGAAQALGATLGLIPNFTIGPFSFGATEGGSNIGMAAAIAGDVIGIKSNINSVVGSMAATKGSFVRRKEDWDLQVKLATTELKQIDKQIIAAQIRQAMAEKELSNHKLQVQNAQEMDEAMRDKYTNEELYDWMVGQISFSYFAAFRLAVDVAKRAERCYQNELNLPLASFIGYEYWDSLHKGLLAGEQLTYDIKRMEVSYLEKNKRTLELTKHISLATLDPESLLKLRTKKSCTVNIPEWMYDMDYPGQHMRRIKSVSVSIPCVAGPYTTVACKLSLLKSRYRKNTALLSSGSDAVKYKEKSGDDERFQYIYGPIQSIATSHAQNDSGMFDFSFRDERYLPFEGAGAVSEWRIELPATYAQFDYDSVSDIILHINYTALDEGSLKEPAIAYVKDALSPYDSSSNPNGVGFMRLFNLRHEFPNEWHTSCAASTPLPPPVKIKLHQDLFPFYTSGKSISMVPAYIMMKVKQGLVADDYTLLIGYTNDAGSIVKAPYSFVATSNDKYAVYELNTTTPPAPILAIDGNVRILKIYLEDSNGYPVNTGTVAEDINLVTINYLKDYQKKADDADWVDYPIPAGMEVWWKADAGIAISGTHITGWEDQSGNGHDLTPLSLNTGPLVDTGLVRGIAPLVFNNSHALYSGAFSDTQDFTVATLVKVQNPYTTGILGRNSGNAYVSSWCVWIFGNNYRVFSVNTGGANPPHANCTATINSGWQLLVCRRDAANGTFKIWLNGVLVKDLTCGNSFIQSNQPISIGALQDTGYMSYGDFKMLESAIYNRALTDDEIADSFYYFKNRYNLF